jgi:hypothetical protein
VDTLDRLAVLLLTALCTATTLATISVWINLP